MRRPGYTLTRTAFWVSFWLAWAVMLALLGAGLFGADAQRAGALALAPTFVPSMVLMVAGVLGIHRAFGALDFRAQTAAKATTEEED